MHYYRPFNDYNFISALNIHYLQPHYLKFFIFISMSSNSNPKVPSQKAELKLYL